MKNLHAPVHLSGKTLRNPLLNQRQSLYINIIFEVLKQGTDKDPIMYFHHSNKWTLIFTLDHFSFWFHVDWRFFFYCRPSTQGNHLTVQVQQDIIGLSFQRDSRFPFCLFSSVVEVSFFFFLIASAAQNSMPWGWWGKMRRIDFWGNSSLNGKLVLSWAFLSVCFSGLWRLVIFRACPAQ